jgi:hypothetical protein
MSVSSRIFAETPGLYVLLEFEAFWIYARGQASHLYFFRDRISKIKAKQRQTE